MTAEELIQVQHLVRRVPVGESVVETILAIVRNGRPESSELEEVRSQVAWGPGPRASQALMLAVRARALIDGRLAPSIEDVLALAHPVLKHRMARSEEHTSELQSLMRISYAVFCLKKKTTKNKIMKKIT